MMFFSDKEIEEFISNLETHTHTEVTTFKDVVNVRKGLTMCHSCDYYNTTGNDAECGIEYPETNPEPEPVFVHDCQALIGSYCEECGQDTIPSPAQSDIEDEDEDSGFHLSSKFYRAFIREVKRVENGY